MSFAMAEKKERLGVERCKKNQQFSGHQHLEHHNQGCHNVANHDEQNEDRRRIGSKVWVDGRTNTGPNRLPRLLVDRQKIGRSHSICHLGQPASTKNLAGSGAYPVTRVPLSLTQHRCPLYVIPVLIISL